jgi:tetratricopeptide (TPR) repeat protein
LSKDGEPHGFAVTPRHWQFARRLLAAVFPSPADDPFVRQWYRATTAHMFRNLRWDESEDQLDFARRTIGLDAQLEFDSGCLYERLASPSTTVVIDTLHRMQPVGPVVPRAASLSKAEGAFKEAVRRDPGFVEARVRLGRVMTLRGHSEEALELLRPVLEQGGTGSIVGYFAALFLGDVHERAGRREAARAAYRQAATLYPDAQSPRLALSALAIASGDRADGVAALEHLLRLPPDEQRRYDPWWLYYIGVGRHSESLMKALWASVPKAGAR